MEKAQRVLITGANRGIGFEMAKTLMKRQKNLELILTCRKPEDQDTLIKSLVNLYPDYKANIKLFERSFNDGNS